MHVPSGRNREKEIVCRFPICAILKRHNSIQHAVRFVLRHFEMSRLNETSRCTQWPLSAMTYCGLVPVELSHCTCSLTHCCYKASKPSQCTRSPLHQTNAVVPDTFTFAVEPEKGAALIRPKATHYNLRLLLVLRRI